MKCCDNCGREIVFGGYPEGNYLFCSKDCKASFKPSAEEFCESCLAETIDITKKAWQAILFVAASNVYGLLGKNIRLRLGFEFGPFDENRCPRCGSVIAKLWICFIIPIIPLDKYRILYRKNMANCRAGDIKVRKLRGLI